MLKIKAEISMSGEANWHNHSILFLLATATSNMSWLGSKIILLRGPAYMYVILPNCSKYILAMIMKISVS
jgi:hypothetical protein